MVTPNFTESVAESVDYAKSMKFDFLYIKGAYETPRRTKKGIAESANTDSEMIPFMCP